MIHKRAVIRALDAARVKYNTSRMSKVIQLKCPNPNGHDKKTPSFVIYTDEPVHFHCFGCLDQKEYIWTEKGLTRIKNVRVGDRVLTHKGRFQPISAKQKKKVSSARVIKTASFRSGLVLTDDHTCLRIPISRALTLPFVGKDSRRPYGIKYSKARANRGLGIFIAPPRWETCEAKDLRGGDFVGFPVCESRQVIELHAPNAIRPYTSGPRTPRIRGIPVTEKLAWFYGLWLAEGSVGRGSTRLTCSLEELGTLIQRAQNIVTAELNLPSTATPIPEHNTSELIISKTDLAAQLVYWFGRGSGGKRIPGECLRWPQNLQRALIRGYFDGDGCINVATTVSKQLALGIFALSIQAGYLPSLTTSPPYVDADGVKHKRSWTIRLKRSPSLSGAFCEIEGHRYYVTQVLSSKKSRKKRIVVDITVEGDSSFVAKSFAVHNCGAHGGWEELQELLKVGKLDSDWDDPKAWSNLRIILERLGRVPCLPPRTKAWVEGNFREVGQDILTRIHSRWWFDEIDNTARLLWPIWDSWGDLAGWVGRRLDSNDTTRKYRNAPAMEILSTLWPFPRPGFFPERHLVLVEGPYDALRLLCHGIPALAMLGTNWSRDRSTLLEVLGVDRVTIALDGDYAGKEGTYRIGPQIAKHIGEDNLFVWEWSPKQDPGSAPMKEVRELRKHVVPKHTPRGYHPWIRLVPGYQVTWQPDGCFV